MHKLLFAVAVAWGVGHMAVDATALLNIAVATDSQSHFVGGMSIGFLVAMVIWSALRSLEDSR